MSADPLDQLLRLVAEGRITAAEAAPILTALDGRPDSAARAGSPAAPGPARPGASGPPGAGDLGQDDGTAGPGFDGPASFDRPSSAASALRLEVRENGRQVVNLRLPIAVGRLALDRVPGLSGEQVEEGPRGARLRHARTDPPGGGRGQRRPDRPGVTSLAGARSLPMWQSLRVRDFRLLWASEAISVVGDQFHYVALAWLVIDRTQSGLALGTILIATGVPRALMLLPFGVLADRRPPRSLMLVAHLARGVIVGALAALVLTGTGSLPVLAILGALFGIADALYIPAQQAFLPRTLDVERLPSANAMLQGTLQLASIAGPPLAGAVIAVVGTGAAFVVDSASFFVAALVVALISARGGVAAGQAPVECCGAPRAPRAPSRPHPRRASSSPSATASGSPSPTRRCARRCCCRSSSTSRSTGRPRSACPGWPRSASTPGPPGSA